MTYQRVLPRDLFNEANLLKCYGQLWLKLQGRPADQVELDIRDHPDGSPARFMIEQNENDGSLTIVNVLLVIRGKWIYLHRPLNSREPWPLYASLGDSEFPVFTDEGELSEEFKLMLDNLLEAP